MSSNKLGNPPVDLDGVDVERGNGGDGGAQVKGPNDAADTATKNYGLGDMDSVLSGSVYTNNSDDDDMSTPHPRNHGTESAQPHQRRQQQQESAASEGVGSSPPRSSPTTTPNKVVNLFRGHVEDGDVEADGGELLLDGTNSSTVHAGNGYDDLDSLLTDHDVFKASCEAEERKLMRDFTEFYDYNVSLSFDNDQDQVMSVVSMQSLMTGTTSSPSHGPRRNHQPHEEGDGIWSPLPAASPASVVMGGGGEDAISIDTIDTRPSLLVAAGLREQSDGGDADADYCDKTLQFDLYDTRSVLGIQPNPAQREQNQPPFKFPDLLINRSSPTKNGVTTVPTTVSPTSATNNHSTKDSPTNPFVENVVDAKATPWPPIYNSGPVDEDTPPSLIILGTNENVFRPTKKGCGCTKLFRMLWDDWLGRLILICIAVIVVAIGVSLGAYLVSGMSKGDDTGGSDAAASGSNRQPDLLSESTSTEPPTTTIPEFCDSCGPNSLVYVCKGGKEYCVLLTSALESFGGCARCPPTSSPTLQPSVIPSEAPSVSPSETPTTAPVSVATHQPETDTDIPLVTSVNDETGTASPESSDPKESSAPDDYLDDATDQSIETGAPAVATETPSIVITVPDVTITGTDAPESDASDAPSSLRNTILAAVSSTTASLIREDSRSAPARALSWLEAQETSAYGNDRILQRFAIASMAFNGGVYRWATNTTWLNRDVSECGWYGVECDGNGHIVSIDLKKNRVGGKLIPELSLLSSSLVYLDLGHNELKGNMPQQFAQVRVLLPILVFCLFVRHAPLFL